MVQALVALVAAVVQVAALNQIVVAGAHADLFLLLAISAGLAAGLFVQTPYGLCWLCYVLVAFRVGLTAGIPSGRLPLGFQLATALLSGVGSTLLFGLGTLIGQPSGPRHQLVVIVVVVTAGCVVLAALAYRLLEWTIAIAPGVPHDAVAFASGSTR